MIVRLLPFSVLQRRMDTVMEVERLKALKMYEEREMRRKEDQKNGAQVDWQK